MDPNSNGGAKHDVEQLRVVIELDIQLTEAKARLKAEHLRQYDRLRSRGAAPSETVVQLVPVSGGGLCAVCNRVVPTAHFFHSQTGVLIRCQNCGRFVRRGAGQGKSLIVKTL